MIKFQLIKLFTISNNSATSILGGTAEALGGGKFANGAITGAFVVLFNHLAHQDNNQSEGDWPTTKELERDFAESFKENVMETYVNDENYVPTDSDDLAQDLLYSGNPCIVLVCNEDAFTISI